MWFPLCEIWTDSQYYCDKAVKWKIVVVNVNDGKILPTRVEKCINIDKLDIAQDIGQQIQYLWFREGNLM